MHQHLVQALLPQLRGMLTLLMPGSALRALGDELGGGLQETCGLSRSAERTYRLLELRIAEIDLLEQE